MTIHYFNLNPETLIYEAAVKYNGKREICAVWKQAGLCYVITGAKIGGDFVRHDFSPFQQARFQDFVESGCYNSPFCAEGF